MIETIEWVLIVALAVVSGCQLVNMLIIEPIRKRLNYKRHMSTLDKLEAEIKETLGHRKDNK